MRQNYAALSAPRPSLSCVRFLDCTIIIIVDCSGTTGEIPPEIGSFSTLQWLDLSGNELSGKCTDRDGRGEGAEHPISDVCRIQCNCVHYIAALNYHVFETRAFFCLKLKLNSAPRAPHTTTYALPPSK